MLRRALDWLAVLSLALAVALGAVWASHILPRQFHLRFWWRSSNPTRPAFEFASSFNYLYFERYRWNDQPVPGPIASDHFTQVAFEARFGGRRFYDNALRLRRWTEPLVRTSPDGRLAMHGTLTT